MTCHISDVNTPNNIYIILTNTHHIIGVTRVMLRRVLQCIRNCIITLPGTWHVYRDEGYL